ncbi:DoxX family protein [Spirosoma arcticum]
MATDQPELRRRKRIGYWITTGLLVFGMVAGGIGQLTYAKFNADGMVHLGYPLYTMRIIGAWKLLGVIAILIPGYGLLKEWAYAGFFFILTGATVSHIVSGDQFPQWVAPFTFAVLTVLSWALRPANRRIAAESLAN